jgi:hypothetical protein
MTGEPGIISRTANVFFAGSRQAGKRKFHSPALLPKRSSQGLFESFGAAFCESGRTFFCREPSPYSRQFAVCR